ncbi:cytochrome b-c1 complex subunit 8-like [Trichosurus vulpecula]|uniref:cytochrome b-c1 complex subunit 8-like n=1 Tax=Trichosurus vulpecula TaxID=9337 RepID=UPI00186AE063|nr:cytochrome b-c1 complex subunit 8-like [Trichosurus vulpecula]
MGPEFGNLMRVRRTISYNLSALEQRAFPNNFTKGIPNVFRRTQDSILQDVPPHPPPPIAFYFIYTWGTQEFEKPKRKTWKKSNKQHRGKCNNLGSL